MIICLGQTSLKTRYGEFILSGWYDGISESYSLHQGKLDGAIDVPVRLHSSCIKSHYFNGISCDCVQQMAMAQELVQSNGIGLIVVQQQESKSNGILATLNQHKAGPDITNSYEAFERLGFQGDSRDYRASANIISSLGIATIVLLSNNPRKREGLERYGIVVASAKSVKVEGDTSLDDFYRGKQISEGHLL